ncbi:hypothetical protein GOV07_05300 [Candidatus Woesearchaeota archaeon]|nr:hypothetical protein [Candidatus Woesearchaeota archaeon]
MAIVGFSFTSISAEKKAAARGNVKINNNVVIKDVKDANLNMATGKKGVRVHFGFQTIYDPEIGNIAFEGDVILLEDTKAAEKILESWKKEKHLPKELMPPILNHILERANVQALIMARDIGLPSPIPMPKVTAEQKAPAKKKTAKKK